MIQGDAGELGPCPRCGKREGKVRDAGAGRFFPWFVICQECSWSTDPVRNQLVAVKLWNDANRRKDAVVRPVEVATNFSSNKSTNKSTRKL